MPTIQTSKLYQPKLSYFFRKDRNRWILEYTLPSDQKEINTLLTLPKKYTEKMEKKVKAFANEKILNLQSGKLTDKEYKKVINSLSSQKIHFSNAVNTFHNILGSTKTKCTINSERRSLSLALRFFEDEFSLQYIEDVQKKHILAYKENLLHKAKQREDKKEMIQKIKSLTENQDQMYALDLELKRTGISLATARSYFRDCKTLFNKLFKNGKIFINPVEDVEPIIIAQEHRTRSKTFSVDDVVAILNSPYKHKEGFPIKEYFELKMELGPRDNELICMEWEDIDFENKVWNLDKKPMCPTRYGMGFSPKNGKRRIIHLSDRAISILNKIPRRQSVGYIAGDDTPYPANFVFTTKDYRKRYSKNYGGWCRPNSIKSAWRSLLKSSGLAYKGMDKLCSHDLRRFRNEVDKHLNRLNDLERSQKLGHSIKVNKEHYSSDNFDQKIVSLANENASLKREVLMLKSQLKQLAG